MTPLSPAADTAIARTYSAESLEQKVQNKLALQRSLGWPEEPKRAMLCLPCGMSEKLGGELLREMLPGLQELPIEIVILGKGSAGYGAFLTEIAAKNSHRIAILENTDASIRKMLAASDIALFLADPAGMPELRACLLYGTVPVAPATTMLEDYHPNNETGNAFLFQKQNAWLAFGAIVRALETYKFPFDWRTIQKHCMEQ